MDISIEREDGWEISRGDRVHRLEVHELLAFLASGFVTVPPDERRVQDRGKVHGTVAISADSLRLDK